MADGKGDLFYWHHIFAPEQTYFEIRDVALLNSTFHLNIYIGSINRVFLFLTHSIGIKAGITDRRTYNKYMHSFFSNHDQMTASICRNDKQKSWTISKHQVKYNNLIDPESQEVQHIN